MTEFCVGEAAPPPFNLRNNAEGATLEQAANGTPIILVALPNMTPGESARLRRAPIQARYISEGAYWLGLVRFGEDKRPPLYELEHAPSLYFSAERARRLEAWGRPIPWQVLGVDSHTGILQCVRIVSPPDPFRESLHLSVGAPRGRDYARRYADWLARLRDNSIKDLWTHSTPAGTFGGAAGGEEEPVPDRPAPSQGAEEERGRTTVTDMTTDEHANNSCDFISTSELAKAWGVSPQRIQQVVSRIPGVIRVGRAFIFPRKLINMKDKIIDSNYRGKGRRKSRWRSATAGGIEGGISHPK